MSYQYLKTIAVTLTFLSIVASDLSGQASQPETVPAPRSQDDKNPLKADRAIANESLKALKAEVARYIANDFAVGAELLVIEKGRVLLHDSFGFSDREEKRHWKNDTICNIRSMTKPITASAAQVLIDRKQLELDKPVATYLESFDNDKSRSITVRQVLTHRSGLPLTNLFRVDQYSNLVEQAGAAGKSGPVHPPGSKFWYSDTGTDVVGALVEKVSGEPLNEFVKREIFEPLGMTNTIYGIDGSDKRFASVASLYVKSSKGWYRSWNASKKPFYPFAWGSQTVYSTTTDYAKFLKMMINHGRVGDRQVLSVAAVSRMLKPVSRLKMMGSDREVPTGFRNLETYYGQMMVTHRLKGKVKEKPVVIGHSGSDGTNSWAWPERDLVILYFTQSRGGMSVLRIEDPIDRLIIHHEAAADKEVPNKLKPYIGTFIANFGKFKNEELTVLVRNGKLVLDVPSELAFELSDPDENDHWAFVIAPRISVTFDRNEKDEVVGLKMHKGGRAFEVPRKMKSPSENN